MLQIISFLGFFKKIRKTLLISIPIAAALFGYVSPNYTDSLIGKFGVMIGMDSFSRYLIVVSSMMLAVIFAENIKEEIDFSRYFFYVTSVFVLNFVFISKDLFNLYILLEAISILAVLMMMQAADKKKLWVSLKYLLIGNVGANIYLLGVLIYYLHTGTFHIIKNADVSSVAANLMILGLLVRTGVFGFGMWLPQFHSNADKTLSAMFSGVFVNGGIYALKLINDVKTVDYMTVLGISLSLAAAVLGFFSKDVKRTIALSTMNHLGIIVMNLTNSTLYIAAHSIAKTLLFLESDKLKREEIPISTWIVSFISIASLSGFPLTLGFKAEHILTENFSSHLTLLVLISNTIIGSSLFKHLWKKFKKGFDGLLILSLPLLYAAKFGFLNVIGVIITLVLSLFKPKRTVYIPVESLDYNLLFILGAAAVILWFS